jgi:hypothetical protein
MSNDTHLTIPEIVRLAGEVAASPRLERRFLMRILRECYRLGRSPIHESDRLEMIRRIGETRLSEGANRAYVNRKTENIYTLMIRLVFASKKERSNASRYANVLQWLAKQETSVEDFEKVISENGGMSEIYWKERNRNNKTTTRNKITLSNALTFEIDQVITLTLKPNSSGIFKIIKVTNEQQ